MTDPSIEVRNLALRLLDREANGAKDPESLARGLQSALQKIQHALVALLGTGGVHSLMGRSLKVAQRVHPVLATVSVDTQPDLVLLGLSDALASIDGQNRDDPANAAIIAGSILEQLICLLISLLGEDIGLIPVKRTWPGILHNFTLDPSREIE